MILGISVILIIVILAQEYINIPSNLLGIFSSKRTRAGSSSPITDSPNSALASSISDTLTNSISLESVSSSIVSNPAKTFSLSLSFLSSKVNKMIKLILFAIHISTISISISLTLKNSY